MYHQIHHLATNAEHRQEQRELLDEGLEVLDHKAIDQAAKRKRVKQKDHDDGVDVVRVIFDGSQWPADRPPVAGVRQQRERQRQSVYHSGNDSRTRMKISKVLTRVASVSSQIRRAQHSFPKSLRVVVSLVASRHKYYRTTSCSSCLRCTKKNYFDFR